jgi:hypothetical protein
MPRVKVWVWWLSVSFVFAALLTRSDFGVARGLPAIPSFGIWFGHVALGLGAAIAATRWLGGLRWMASRSPVAQLLVGGLIGSIAFAPMSTGLEAVFPSPQDDGIDGWLDVLEQRGGLTALIAEWLQFAPAYLASWAILNAPPLLAAMSLRPAILAPVPQTDEVGIEVGRRRTPEDPSPSAADAAGPPSSPDADANAVREADSEAEAKAEAEAEAEVSAAASMPLLARIPPAIGTNLVVVQSDLHYLHVRTPRGSATLLGTISELESEMGDRGLRVHRSFWVALDHVRRVRRTAAGWHCVMSDQSKVPVSRRRLAAVKERLGVDFVRETSAAGE